MKRIFKKTTAIEPFVMACWTGCAVLLWLFHEIAETVFEGGSKKIDERLLLALRNQSNPDLPRGPAWLFEAARDVSSLGSITVLGTLSVLTCIYLVMTGNRLRAFYILTAAVAGTAISHLLKLAYIRPRPDVVQHSTQVFSTSFPSAHSMMSAVIFLSIGMMLARAHDDKAIKIYFLSISIILSLAVGISRIYLGVHWPSDVLAGWIAGGALSLIFLTGKEKLSGGF